MASENQQQEFELLTDDDDWSDSPKAGKSICYWNPIPELFNEKTMWTRKTNET